MQGLFHSHFPIAVNLTTIDDTNRELTQFLALDTVLAKQNAENVKLTVPLRPKQRLDSEEL